MSRILTDKLTSRDKEILTDLSYSREFCQEEELK